MAPLEDYSESQFAISEQTELVEYSLQQLAEEMVVMPTLEASLLRLKYQEGLNIGDRKSVIFI